MPHPSVTAETYPHKPAIIMGNSGELVSYRQLSNSINRAAQLFLAAGLRVGDHLALMLENRHEFLSICWAAQTAGLIYTPISSHLKADETAYILRNCGAKMFIASAAVADVAMAAAADIEKLETKLMLDGIREGFQSWEEAIDGCGLEPIANPINGAPMLYSSGTTGQPKGVRIQLPEPDINAPHPLAGSIGLAFGFGEETVYLSPAPLYHAAPLHFNMMVQSLGGTSVIMEKFVETRALELIEEHRVTHSQWVPIMFVRMLKLPESIKASFDLSSHQFAIHAAAPCPVETKERMIDWWGPIIVEYYGSSEGIGLTLIDSEQWLAHRGSVGRAVSGVLHILDEQDKELPPGEIGTVYFGGTQANFSYHDEPEKTANSYNKEGWATCGDVGYVDDEGFLYLTDRKHFMIISGGVNVYPQEVENLLITHDKVADVAVFGIPNEDFGEEVKAVVQPRNWADATDTLAIELIEWLRERLSHVKVPRSIDFNEQLPRLDNGKLYKRHLVEAYRSAPESSD
ncbi:MAG: acyl-CoA synthetase [Pseudomonadota bacterium]